MGGTFLRARPLSGPIQDQSTVPRGPLIPISQFRQYQSLSGSVCPNLIAAAYGLARPGRAVSFRDASMRQNGYAAISFACCPNMSIHLLVNSVVTAKNSVGNLIAASLKLNSKAKCQLAWAISTSFA